MAIEYFKEQLHRFLNRNSSIILMYHGVVDYALPFEMWTHISSEVFFNQMEFIVKNCNVMSLAELSKNIFNKNSVKHAVVVTFDDGFANNYYNAYPILKRFGLPATIFLTTGYMGGGSLLWPEHLAYLLMRTSELMVEFGGKSFLLSSGELSRQAYCYMRDYLKTLHPARIDFELKALESLLNVSPNQEDPLFRQMRLLDWQQVNEMEREGYITFGGHTVNHTILSRLDEGEAYEQIRLCREALDGHLESVSRLWAYPNGRVGDFSKQHRDMLLSVGFDVIVTTEQEYITAESKISEMGRWGIGGEFGMPEFRRLIYKCGWLDGFKPARKLSRVVAGIFR